MDLIDDIEVQGHIVRKIKVMHLLVVLLASIAVVIVASSQEARRDRHKRRRAACPLYKRIIHSSNTDCHDQICMSRVAFFWLAKILRLKREHSRYKKHITGRTTSDVPPHPWPQSNESKDWP